MEQALPSSGPTEKAFRDFREMGRGAPCDKGLQAKMKHPVKHCFVGHCDSFPLGDEFPAAGSVISRQVEFFQVSLLHPAEMAALPLEVARLAGEVAHHDLLPHHENVGPQFLIDGEEPLPPIFSRVPRAFSSPTSGRELTLTTKSRLLSGTRWNSQMRHPGTMVSPAIPLAWANPPRGQANRGSPPSRSGTNGDGVREGFFPTRPGGRPPADAPAR